MPRPPRFISPDAIEETTLLPAVSAVMVGGFLAEAAPIAAFGPAKSPETYLLLTHEQRGKVSRAIPEFDTYTDLIPLSEDRRAVLGASGRPGRWSNGENLWVSARWLEWMAPRVSAPSHGASLVLALARKALG